jgi:hypothetical protein
MSADHTDHPQAEFDFDMQACMAMMETLLSEHGDECDCSEMMSRITGQGQIPDEWRQVMWQMMGFHSREAEGEGND